MLKNVKLRTKLYVGFIFVSLIMIFIGCWGIFKLNESSESDTLLFEKNTKSIADISEIILAYQRIRVNVRDIILNSNDKNTQQQKQLRVINFHQHITNQLQIFEKNISDDKVRTLFEQTKKDVDTYYGYALNVIQLAMNGKQDEAFSLLKGDAAISADNSNQRLIQLLNMNENLARQRAENNSKQTETANTISLYIIILGVLITIFFGFALSSNIMKQLGGDPLLCMDIANNVAKGNLSMEIITKEKDKSSLLVSMKQMVLNIKNLVNDANMLSNAAIAGKLDVRADASKHQGDYKVIVDGVNKTLDNVIGPLNVAAEYVDRISKGDTPPKITENYNGDFNEIKNNLNTCIDAISSLVDETGVLINSAKEGKLDVRANVKKVQGVYSKLLKGFNETLDAVIGPLNVAAEYIDRISKGDIPPKIHDNYNGDFNEIKNNLNTCIGAVSALVNDANLLSKAAIEGKLDTRADATKHQGDFRVIVDGVNRTLDAVIGPLNVAAEYVDRISKGDIPPRITDSYNGDFNEIKNNLNTCIGAVNALVADANMLSKAAIEGRLETRADASRHHGDFAKIVNGVNQTLDSVIDPINEAANVLSIMANGDLTVRMEGDYQGDHQKLKNSINSVINSLNNLLREITDAVQSTASAALQISSTSDTMAAGAAEQSAQADEVATAVEQMSRTITQNAMSATKTADTAERNGLIAKDGEQVVDKTVAKMRDIAQVVKKSADNIEKLGESSQKIGEIISVIDDIADQTNLLALNAAIEAARAGDQGRGFAVVADEVRKLAERTTEATKQIANMIKGIQKETVEAVNVMQKGNDEVSNGIELADRAGKSLSEVVQSSLEVQNMISQIAAASEEQSSTSEQIARNVQTISSVSAESARNIQDIAGSSNELSKLTEHLSDLMSQFQIDNAHSNSVLVQKTTGKNGHGLNKDRYQEITNN